ncbi:hypothetical protein PGTUg99_018797 [Puccinia graminis f. sp. tritici]|uniref:Uncharacterized protein n=1 Tax=Puccinia graminis f. sp. tritici TaxID=56615 RepID=A0A5B0RK18_PUCGR|nr:hypothetical protein PGTUg99_018797 [Puccinia graminis f. sp. tritici]
MEPGRRKDWAIQRQKKDIDDDRPRFSSEPWQGPRRSTRWLLMSVRSRTRWIGSITCCTTGSQIGQRIKEASLVHSKSRISISPTTSSSRISMSSRRIGSQNIAGQVAGRVIIKHCGMGELGVMIEEEGGAAADGGGAVEAGGIGMEEAGAQERVPEVRDRGRLEDCRQTPVGRAVEQVRQIPLPDRLLS